MGHIHSNAPTSVLDQIDQLAIEFHGAKEPRFLDVIQKLKRKFYIANLHFNNYSCARSVRPFPAWAYEVLFVSKRVGDARSRHSCAVQSVECSEQANGLRLPDTGVDSLVQDDHPVALVYRRNSVTKFRHY